MVREFNNNEELYQGIHDDILYLYNECSKLGIITGGLDDVEYYINDFTRVNCLNYPNLNLFRIRDRYTVTLTYVGLNLDGVVYKKDLIIDYHDRFILRIRDYVDKKYLSGKPFTDMGLDDIVNYLQNDQLCKSNNFKFRYDIIRDGEVVHFLCGNDTTSVEDYFKIIGGRDIKMSPISETEDHLTVYSEDRKFEFIVRRVSINNQESTLKEVDFFS